MGVEGKVVGEDGDDGGVKWLFYDYGRLELCFYVVYGRGSRFESLVWTWVVGEWMAFFCFWAFGDGCGGVVWAYGLFFCTLISITA